MRLSFAFFTFAFLILVGGLSSFINETHEDSFNIIGGNIIDENVRTDTVQISKRLDIAQFEMENITSKPIHLSIKRLQNSFPKEWDYSMCAYGQCQIGIPEYVTLKTIEPGAKGFVAIHVMPMKKKGIGIVQFEITDVHSSQKEQITFNVISN